MELMSGFHEITIFCWTSKSMNAEQMRSLLFWVVTALQERQVRSGQQMESIRARNYEWNCPRDWAGDPGSVLRNEWPALRDCPASSAAPAPFVSSQFRDCDRWTQELPPHSTSEMNTVNSLQFTPEPVNSNSSALCCAWNTLNLA